MGLPCLQILQLRCVKCSTNFIKYTFSSSKEVLNSFVLVPPVPVGGAFIDLIVKYDWDAITILYENNDSMMRLKGIFDRTAEVKCSKYPT